ncbi:MAG: ABC transporter ATP-binding protein [Carboxydocellales bacterium]
MQVEIKNLSKFFMQKAGRKFIALNHVNLKVRQGEFVALLGPSGCGKTTLLNIIAGLDSPSTGQATVDGKAVHGPGPDRVVVFQEAALFPWLSSVQNVEFGLKVAGIEAKTRRQKALEFLQMVQLSQFASEFPHQLSGGMRQRLAIARALILDPKILLMDEPFAALDEHTRGKLQGELVDIWVKTGKTIVFVTHNIREALIMADRVCIFAAGPGRIKRELLIPIPRPRCAEDPLLLLMEKQIQEILREQASKVNLDKRENLLKLIAESF